MIEWMKKIFGTTSSSSTAKERLRLVLMTDHLALSPEIIENIKRDLVDVISRYVEVDREKVEVNFEREDRALAMLANIPIVSVNRPVPPPQPPAPPVDPTPNAGPPPVRKRRRKKPPAQNPAAVH
jgi:cell division topological specificity factor